MTPALFSSSSTLDNGTLPPTNTKKYKKKRINKNTTLDLSYSAPKTYRCTPCWRCTWVLMHPSHSAHWPNLTTTVFLLYLYNCSFVMPLSFHKLWPLRFCFNMSLDFLFFFFVDSKRFQSYFDGGKTRQNYNQASWEWYWHKKARTEKSLI